MIYLLITLLFIFCIIDFLKNKKILSPSFIFNLVWFVTLSLYQFKLSYIQQKLSNKTILIFFICIISYNLTLFIMKFIKIKKIKFNFGLKSNIEKKVKIARYIIILIFIIEIIYSKGLPLIWKLIGNGKTYFDYGIPSLHGAFCGLVICLGAYSLFAKTKDKYLYFAIGILLISRQILISIIVEWLVITLFNKNLKDTIKKIAIVGVIGIIGFNLIGNFRSGNDVMIDVFQAKPQYANLPKSAKWIYSYMTFSVSNFNNLVSLTDGGINKGVSTLNEFLPTILLNKLNINSKFHENYLISLNYNVSTYLPSLYLDFGMIGIAVFNILIAVLGYILYNNLNGNRDIKNLLLYSVFVHNIVFLFFINMFIYLPVVVQFIYIFLIFKEKETKEEVEKLTTIEKEELISVVVPVYNVEKYLRRCLDSLINQTYTNLEIILVDDGSTDNSGKMCDEYAQKDQRIKVFHKVNGGSSDARNFGIKKATGEYLGFIDADDYIDTDMYKILYEGCINNNCMISWCDKYFENENGNYMLQKLNNIPEKMTKEKAFATIMLNDASLCDKLFKRKLFDKINFVVGALYEDIMPLCYSVDKAGFVYYVGCAKYHYIQREGSNVHHFDLRKLDYIKNAEKFSKYALKQYPSLIDITDSYCILVLCTLITDMYPDRKKYNKVYNKLMVKLCKYKNKYLKNRNISLMKKIMCFLIIHRKISSVINIKKILKKIKYR